MHRNRRLPAITSLSFASILWMAGCTAAVYGQDAAAALGSVSSTAVPVLIREMAGTWDVQQRMWTGPSATPIDLPSAIAHRRLVQDVFLEEVMTPVSATGAPFTRVAVLNYNAVSRQYEYFSLDSRAPQAMTYDADAQARTPAVMLRGGTFVAAKWGDDTNVSFRYRLELSEIQNDGQSARLYLTRQSDAASEFLAFEYRYRRRR